MDEDMLKAILETNQQLLKWSRFAGTQQLRTILAQNLSSDEMKRVYELSDGNRGTREIAKIAKIGSNVTVAAYWKKWKIMGLVEPSSKFKGRFQRIVSLAEVGIEGPHIESADSETTVEVDESG